jgi:hypothetical protein
MMDLAILADTTDKNRRGIVPVPQTHARTTPAPPVFPPGRYGRRREPARRRRGAMALALLAVLAVSAALAVRLYQRYGDPAYRADVVAYTEITDSQVLVRFRVHLPAGREAVCAVRARDRAGTVVGRADVPVPAGRGEVTYRLSTTARPFVAEVVRCRAAH